MMTSNQPFSKVCISVVVFAFLLFASSCEEVPPLIDFSEPPPIDLTCADKFNLDKSEFSTTNTSFVSEEVPEAQCKMVLIEEFSGVRCVNCPAGHETTAQILAERPDEIAALTIHAGFLSEPYPENKEDYVIEAGTFLYDFLQTIAVPSASVDRVLYEGENFISLVNRNVWQGKANQRLQMTPPVNVYTNYELNSATGELQVFVRVHYLEAFDASASHLVSVSLSESHIVDHQLIPTDNGSTVQADYVHDHVLRAMLTPATGLSLDVDKVVGTVVDRVFDITLPQNWKAEDMEIVAFVHDGSTNHVLQAAKKHLEVE